MWTPPAPAAASTPMIAPHASGVSSSKLSKGGNSGKAERKRCLALLLEARTTRCAALVQVPAAFLALADEESEGVRDCERCLLQALRMAACDAFAVQMLARAANKDLVTWDSPLQLCLKPA